MTQEQLGERLQLGKAAISSWEVNRTQPSATQVAMLCQQLNVSADYLVGIPPAALAAVASA